MLHSAIGISQMPQVANFIDARSRSVPLFRPCWYVDHAIAARVKPRTLIVPVRSFVLTVKDDFGRHRARWQDVQL